MLHHHRASQHTTLSSTTPSTTTSASSRSPVSITYPIDSTRKVTMQLDFLDAVHYTIAECQTWLRDRQISLERTGTHALERRWAKSRAHRLLLGRCTIAGAPIDDAILYCLRRSNAHFKNNPYGLSSAPYWAIAVSMLLWSLTNLVNGFLDGFEVYAKYPKAKCLTGFMSALPGVWMFILFLKPALIANVKDQYAAMGHII
ncbi:hypothetical protein HBI13_026800 [Parastagonospora nodorum]|nr:hypothetical protein HBI10_043350 [Parastagonospora nodorum]KAH4030946.1 hypothetical protein HBI13_026800 [Parastagonospora nodorum]KAH4609201.1 hypothetical protein HBH82_067930 [Parastagonospora nodorum]KAH4711371.1 hypothetical protein HBH67_022770 [Parastagonospora nodorum]KAH4718295.1 hypothetical protein HBH78_026780 [Parastagonospora nodorum]